MSLKYTKIPSDTWEKIVLNAGVLCDGFTPSTGVIGNILGATTGGITFATNPTIVDFGEDVDNCPARTKQLARITQYDPTCSGTFLTVTASQVASLIGAADVDGTDTTKVVVRDQLEDTDFTDLWWIGDYSDVNTGSTAGYLAIHLKDALNTTGFQIQSTKDGKGTMSFEYHAHYDIENQDDVPFEIYVKQGS